MVLTLIGVIRVLPSAQLFGTWSLSEYLNSTTY